MAALDGKITIGIDYKPCMVHIPAKVKYRKNTSTVPAGALVVVNGAMGTGSTRTIRGNWRRNRS